MKPMPVIRPSITFVSVGLGSYDVAVTVAVFTFLTLRLLTLVKEEDDLKGGGKSEPKADTRSD